MKVTRNIEKEYLILRILTFIRYFGDCFFYGYIYLFLKSRGLDESQIGMITALTPLVALASNPLWSGLSKNANYNRKIMMIITVLEGIAIILFTQVNTIEAIALLTILVAFVGSPFYSLHDGFIGTFAKSYNKDYTKIRYYGALAYFSASMVAALLLNLSNNNYNLLFWCCGISFVAVTFFFNFVKPIDLALVKDGEEVKRNYKAILKNKTFLVYMIVFFLVNTVSFAADNFVGLYFTEYHNLSSSQWSLILASLILTEFITMVIFSKKTEKLNLNVIWVLITILYPIRSIIFAVGAPLPIAIVAACFRGLGYGMILVVNIRCVEKICGIENVTAAFFIMAIFTAVIQALSYTVFGSFIKNMGYQFFFMIVALCGALGFIINIIYQIKHKFKYEVEEQRSFK